MMLLFSLLLGCSRVEPPPPGSWTLGGCAAMPDAHTCVIDGPVDLWSSEELGELRGFDDGRSVGTGTLWTLPEPESGPQRLQWRDHWLMLNLVTADSHWGPAEVENCRAVSGADGAVAMALTLAARSAPDPVPCREAALEAWTRAGLGRDAAMEDNRLAMALLGQARPTSEITRRGYAPEPQDVDLRYASAYVDGILAREQGLHRDARAGFRRALRLAEHGRSSPLWAGAARSELADLASRSGEHNRALRLLAPRVAAATLAEDRFHAHLDIAWAMLRATEEGVVLEEVASAPVAMDPAAHLDLARQLGMADPRLAGDMPDVWVNLALFELQRGRVDAAALALAKADGDTWLRTRHWRSELRARIALARGQHQQAARIWEGLVEEAGRAGDLSATWRAWDGLARAQRALGRLADADRAWSRAQELFVRHAAFVPMFHGREAFLGRRRAAALSQAEVRLQQGDLGGALEVLRAFRRQYFATIRVPEQVEAMDTAIVGGWEASLREYGALRGQREALQQRLHSAPESDQPGIRRQLQQLSEETDQVLDSGMTLMEPSSKGRPRGPRDVVVGLARTHTHWLGAAAGPGRIVADRVPVDADPARLWAKLGAGWPDDTRFVLMPDAGSDALDPHRAAPFMGVSPTVWSLDAPTRGGTMRGNRALVVADPQRNLPSAREEARGVSDALKARGLEVQLLMGRDATRAAVLAALQTPGTGVFHYAGHGELGDDTWDARLALGEDTSLRISDILALERVPELVVLAGCETAVTPHPGGSSFGLAQAFVQSGSQAVVATTRKVDDGVARSFSVAFHEAEPSSERVEVAWNDALRVLRQEQGADWSTFRLFVP